MSQGRVQWITPVTPALWEAEGVDHEVVDHEVRSVSTKNMRISQAWWHTPVVPATQEAETGESLEPGKQRLQ